MYRQSPPLAPWIILIPVICLLITGTVISLVFSLSGNGASPVVAGELTTSDGAFETELVADTWSAVNGFNSAAYLVNMLAPGNNTLVFTGNNNTLLRISATLVYGMSAEAALLMTVAINDQLPVLSSTSFSTIVAAAATIGTQATAAPRLPVIVANAPIPTNEAGTLVTTFLYNATRSDSFTVYVAAIKSNATLVTGELFNSLAINSI